MNDQITGLAFGSFVLHILYTYICFPCLDFITCWKFMRRVWLVVAYRVRTSSRKVATASSSNRTAHVENGIWLLQAVLCWTVQRVAPWVPNPRPAATVVNYVHTITITQFKYLGIPFVFFHVRHANKATVTGVILCNNKDGHPWFTLWEDVMFNPLNAELNPICHLLALLGAHPILHVSRIRVKWTVYFRFPVCN